MSGHIAPEHSTPGPWQAIPTKTWNGGWDGFEIRNIDQHIATCRGPQKLDERKADAYLLAAAPLMYEALANLENDGGKNMPDTAWQLIQDALKAARGEME